MCFRPEDEVEIKDLFEGAEFVYVEDAGHWVHADSPEDFVSLVSDFFNGDVFFRHMKWVYCAIAVSFMVCCNM